MTILDCAVKDLLDNLQDVPVYGGTAAERSTPRSVVTTPERMHALVAAANVVRSLREALELGQ